MQIFYFIFWCFSPPPLSPLHWTPPYPTMRTSRVESNGAPLGIRAKELAHFVSSNQKLWGHFPRAYESKPKQQWSFAATIGPLKELVWMVVGGRPFMRIHSYDACTPQKALQKVIYLSIYLPVYFSIFLSLFIFIYLFINHYNLSRGKIKTVCTKNQNGGLKKYGCHG